MREYLILLSISETSKNKGVRFLDFLLSGESDVGTFSRRAERSAWVFLTARRDGPNKPLRGRSVDDCSPQLLLRCSFRDRDRVPSGFPNVAFSGTGCAVPNERPAG
jgi:hypothetical protein